MKILFDLLKSISSRNPETLYQGMSSCLYACPTYLFFPYVCPLFRSPPYVIFNVWHFQYFLPYVPPWILSYVHVSGCVALFVPPCYAPWFVRVYRWIPWSVLLSAPLYLPVNVPLSALPRRFSYALSSIYSHMALRVCICLHLNFFLGTVLYLSIYLSLFPSLSMLLFVPSIRL